MSNVAAGWRNALAHQRLSGKMEDNVRCLSLDRARERRRIAHIAADVGIEKPGKPDGFRRTTAWWAVEGVTCNSRAEFLQQNGQPTTHETRVARDQNTSALPEITIDAHMPSPTRQVE